MWSLGIDIGGTFTDIVVRDAGRTLARKVLTTHDDPARGVEAGIAAILADRRSRPRSDGTGGARDDPLHQHPHRAKRRPHRPHHHPGVSGYPRDRPRAQVRALRPHHRQAAPARPAPPAARGRGEDGCHRRGAGTARRGFSRRGDCRARTGRGRRGRGRLPPCLRQSGARTPGPRSARGTPPPPGRHHLVGGRAGDPGVRADLHHRRQRLPDAPCRPLCRPAWRSDRGARHRMPPPSSCFRAGGSRTPTRRGVSRCGCSSPVRRRARLPPRGSVPGPDTTICSPSTWAARRPSSASWTAASPSSPTPSRRAGSGASSPGAGSRSRSRLWSSSRSAREAAASPKWMRSGS